MNDLTNNAHAENLVVLRQPSTSRYLNISTKNHNLGVLQSMELSWQSSARTATVMPGAVARKVSSAYILMSGDYDITMEPAGGEA